MSVNATLKSICNLLKHENPAIGIAAIRVLGAIHTREPMVYRMLGELLVTTEDPTIAGAILDALEENPHEQALKYLLQLLEREGDHERVLHVIARIGGKAVPSLKHYFLRVSLAAKKQIVRVLPRIRTEQAHQLLVECCFDPDRELVREEVHALREAIHTYNEKEKNDLYQKIVSALHDKRILKNESALSALLISLGILADIRAKEILLSYVSPDRPLATRRHALMSLGKLELSGDRHHDVFEKLLPILKEADYEGLVRHAVQVLTHLKVRRTDRDVLCQLLESVHPGVKVYAIQALSQIDSVANAELILPYLHAPMPILRDTASQALRRMPSVVPVILRRMDETKDRTEALEMVKILESHGNRIPPAKARALAEHMLDLYQKGDEHYQLYRMALRHLRGEVLQEELVKRAEEARHRQDYATMRDLLKLLDHTELLTPEIRFLLAIAKLKTSKKDFSRTSRTADYCLEHIAILLREDPQGFKKRLLAVPELNDEDLLYVGFHFSERLNEERRFGVDLLRHVIKKWPKRPSAKIASQKLAVEGH